MKMYYSAYTNKGNIGDLLITKYQIDEYAKYGEVYVDCHGMPDSFCQVVFNTESSNIRDFEKEYGCSYRSASIIKVLYMLNKDHFTHFCGSPGPKVSLGRPFRKMLFKLSGALIPELFLSSRIKMFAIGVDVKYDLNSAFSRLNHWYFNRFDVIGLRSKTNYYSLKNSFNNVRYVPDMAFLYPYFDTKTYCKINHRIAFSFRKIADNGNLVKAISEMIKIVVENGFRIDIIYQVDEDKSFCEQILQEIKCQNVSPVIKQIDFYSLNVYKQYDVVVSNRLHVLLMAAMNGAIPYALISHDSKENKIEYMFDTVFSSQLINYIDEYENEFFGRIFENLIKMKTVLLKDVDNQRQQCVMAFKELF